MKRLFLSLLVVLWASASLGASYTKTNTFTAATTAQSSQVNANFDEIATAVNENDGRIDANVIALANEAGLEASLSDVTDILIAAELPNLAALNTLISSGLVTGAHTTNADDLTAGTVLPALVGAAHIDALSELGAMGCTGTQMLEYNGSAWICITTPGAGGDDVQVATLTFGAGVATVVHTYDTNSTDPTTTVDSAGLTTLSHGIAAASFGGITSASLVDKTDIETITGAWTFNADVTLAGALVQTDKTAEPGNLFNLFDNDTAFTLNPDCTNSGTIGKLTIIDKDESAADDWVVCNGKSELRSLTSEVRSMYWGAGAISPDGTNCLAPAEVQINSGPRMYTIICADSDSSIMYGSTIMPDSWNAGDVTFSLHYIQTAVNTASLEGAVAAQCHTLGDTVNSTWTTGVDIDDAVLTGSNGYDTASTATAVTLGSESCSGGDMVTWRWTMNAAATNAAVATLNLVGMKMEYSSSVGD